MFLYLLLDHTNIHQQQDLDDISRVFFFFLLRSVKIFSRKGSMNGGGKTGRGGGGEGPVSCNLYCAILS